MSCRSTAKRANRTAEWIGRRWSGPKTVSEMRRKYREYRDSAQPLTYGDAARIIVSPLIEAGTDVNWPYVAELFHRAAWGYYAAKIDPAKIRKGA